MSNKIVERVAKVMWDEFCPGIRQLPVDVDCYNKLAKKVFAAMSEEDLKWLLDYKKFETKYFS